MGALKKRVRSDVRRLARIVVSKYAREHLSEVSKGDVENAVKKIEARAVPRIVAALKKASGNQASDSKKDSERKNTQRAAVER